MSYKHDSWQMRASKTQRLVIVEILPFTTFHILLSRTEKTFFDEKFGN